MRNVTFPHPKWDKNNLVQNLGNVLKTVPSTELSLVRWPQAGKSSQADLADEIKVMLAQFYSECNKAESTESKIYN